MDQIQRSSTESVACDSSGCSTCCVPPARGTVALSAVPAWPASRENVRACYVARNRKFPVAREPLPGRPCQLGEKPADESGVGDATDREDVGAGAHVRAMPASRFLYFLEGPPHHRF